MDELNRRLMWHGMLLFLIGLVTGLLETRFTNIRMGLAAHLEGVMNGTFLLALGASWTRLKLLPSLERTAFWAAIYGAYANWSITTFAAVFGTGALSPITASGRVALSWQEGVVTIGFATVGVSTIAAAILILWGLRRRASPWRDPQKVG
jgi:hydroxylaminobenzene mutase